MPPEIEASQGVPSTEERRLIAGVLAKDRKATDKDDGDSLEYGQNKLRFGADCDAEGDERQHAEEPDGPGAGCPRDVVATGGRQKVERRLSRRERRGNIEDGRILMQSAVITATGRASG